MLAPVIQLPHLYHINWALSNSYLPNVTSSGPCPMCYPYITSNGPCPIVTSSISQVPSLPYCYVHKYCSPSYSYLPYITLTGPLSPVHPKYLEYSGLPYRNRPYITSTGHCPTDFPPISQVLNPVRYRAIP